MPRLSKAIEVGEELARNAAFISERQINGADGHSNPTPDKNAVAVPVRGVFLLSRVVSFCCHE
jgi:hypothetical protein